MNIAIKNGLLMAATLIACYFGAYFISPTANANSLITIPLFTTIGLALICLTIWQFKSKSQDVITFGESYINGFLTFTVGITVFLVLTYVHYKMDANYAELITEFQKDQAIEMMKKMTEQFNMKGADFDEAMAQIEETDMSMGIGTFILRLLSNIMWGAILALGGGIFGNIIKNK